MAAKIKLTKEQTQYLVGGVFLLAVFGFVYFKFFWLPISKHIAETRAKIDDTSAKIEKAQSQAARLPRIQAELVSLNQQAEAAEQRLPRTNSVPEILVTLTNLAQKAGVDLTSFAPGPKATKDYFIELQYPVTIHGGYHNVGRFLAALSLEERIFNVMNVNYGGPSGEGILNVTFTLISYQYKG